MAVFGASKRVEELEAENASLKQWVTYLNGADAVAIAAQITNARGELAQLQHQVSAARGELATAHAQIAAERASIVETRELAMLQEVGVYDYRHPVESALAYKAALEKARSTIKAMVSGDTAVNATTHWTVNNSREQGMRMVRDLKKLMLRAYNGEADNAVRTLKPHTLDRAIERLAKSRETIARLGKTMAIRVSDDYHRFRVYELELTADYLSKVEEEKEQLRAERERRKEEEKARRDFEAATSKLRKEEAHYKAAYAKAVAAGDAAAATALQQKIDEIDVEIADVEARAANTRAGYVYVISNLGAFGERMIKVGMTRRLEPQDRIRELGDASVPFRFDTHALIFSDDAVSLETRIHQELADRRVNRVNTHREFFYATPNEVRDVLVGIGGPDLLLEYTDIAEALEWRASGAHPTGTPATPHDGQQQPADPRPTAAPSAEVNETPPRPDPNPPSPARPDSQVAPRATDTQRPATPPNGNRPADLAAGWHPDPWHKAPLRWWDGEQWTSHTSQG